METKRFQGHLSLNLCTPVSSQTSSSHMCVSLLRPAPVSEGGSRFCVVPRRAQNSEAIIAVVDCMDDPRGALEMFQPGDNWQGPPMAVLLNKTDLVGPIQLANIKAWYKSTCRAEVVFDGSALEQTGVDELKVGENT